MYSLNFEYYDDTRTIQVGDNSRDIEKAIKNLIHMRNMLIANFPEYTESITDVDFQIATGAYRVNNINLFEETIQTHYTDDYRFKKLYQSFVETQTANVWNNIVKANATNLERTFVRALSLVILTCVCVSLVVRK